MVTEVVSIDAENITETDEVVVTDISPSEGEVDETVGEVESVLVV